ncbi:MULTISPECIES: ferredoxin [unclassified Streptomyces]|uniref:ferredoxin n=1 Tax=unclassified Streptomyces TaxID=2593676 RepID=UPI0006F97CF9|nr:MULTISPECIES: ferredoxin [unclassified Streptomyces]KQX49814.1 ferredoxin [Streptomyces sp. Root1304]KRA80143.1 ferredoxin [Streptomyces sp. Root66D1]
MRVTIDGDLCIGAGQCALTSPGFFTQDDDGFGMVVPGREDGGPEAGPDGDDTLLDEAARACPVQAITIHDPAEASGSA